MLKDNVIKDKNNYMSQDVKTYSISVAMSLWEKADGDGIVTPMRVVSHL